MTLPVQASQAGLRPDQVLAFYGLRPHENLDLLVLSHRNTAASVAFRLAFLRWIAQGGGVVLARSKKYAASALDWCPGRFELIVEAHEVDSVQAVERGEPPEPMATLEQRVLDGACGVVCNCPGTLDVLQATHRLPPSIALHNATHLSRVRVPAGPGQGIGYVGSLLKAKDSGILADVAQLLRQPITLIGPEEDEALMRRSDGWLRFLGPLDHVAVPSALVDFAVLLLPLGRGLFGERLTSPLKVWDYMATGRPIVGANTAALRSAAGDAFEPYEPGNAEDFAAAIHRIQTDAKLVKRRVTAAVLRTWDDRAAELEDFADEVCL
ncbi:MAG: glycosyltransferase [Rhodobacterales bacterium]|nr:glycosyltransferase [Rhodobacterales bacterium]